MASGGAAGSGVVAGAVRSAGGKFGRPGNFALAAKSIRETCHGGVA